MADGPGLALDLVDQIVATHTLDQYHLLHNVRGDLLDRLGRHDEAAAEFRRAGQLATNTAERNLSIERARETEAACLRKLEADRGSLHRPRSNPTAPDGDPK